MMKEHILGGKFFKNILAYELVGISKRKLKVLIN